VHLLNFNPKDIMSRYVKSILGLFVLLSFISIQETQAEAPAHDPSTIVYENGKYWVFCTGDGVWAMSSEKSDFMNWKGQKPIFPKGTWPSWINIYVKEFKGHFWAPDIIFMNDKWYLYYSCSTFGSNKSAIGVATTNSLASEDWTDLGLVTYTDGSQGVNAIDASVMRDEDGKIWLSYGSFWNGIVMTELDSISGKPKNSNSRIAIANNNPEASALVYHDDYYYLFFNRGKCCDGMTSTYHMYVGRSDRPTGPFLDKSGVDCNKGGGTSFLHSDGRFIGPGHFGMRDSLLSYHFYDGMDKGNAKLKVSKIRWKDGWPVAEYFRTGGYPDGTYVLVNKNSNKILKLNNNKTDNGSYAVLGTERGEDSEKWRVTYLDNQYYRIALEVNPTMTLEIKNCSKSTGEVAQVYTDIGTDCQEWYMVHVGSGYYKIVNKNSHHVLEVINALTNDGAIIRQWEYTGHDCQLWMLKRPIKQTGIEALTEESQRANIYQSSKDILQIEMLIDYVHQPQLQLFDQIGQLKLQTTLQSEKNNINIAEKLHSGLYIAKIVDAAGSIVQIQKLLIR
jgi:arabinan endo-1,5-alpha-L-arabinosidase